MSTLLLILLGAYASLLLEILVFPIPSEASTLQLFKEGAEAGPETGEGALSRARKRPLGTKLLRYFLPTALGVALFLVPPFLCFVPEASAWFLPIGPQASGPVALAGVAVVILGRILTFSSVLQLRRERRPGVHGLQPQGIFLRSRNPGLLGMYLFYLGNCLIFPSVVLCLGLFPYIMNMHQKVLLEESRLLELHGRSYSEYQRRTPRYFIKGFSR